MFSDVSLITRSDYACWIEYPGYPVVTGFGFTLPLGHAGVLTVNSTTGLTKYFEYGRYVTKFGEVERRTIPNLTIGADSKPTRDSLAHLYNYLSRHFGKGRLVHATYYPIADYRVVVEGIQLESTSAK